MTYLGNIRLYFLQQLTTLRLFLAGYGTKLFILLVIYLFIIFTAAFVCLVTMYNSDKALLEDGAERLMLEAQRETRYEEQKLLIIEKTIENLSDFIQVTFDITKFEDLNYVKFYRNNVLAPTIKQLFKDSKDVQGMYAYLDVMRINPQKYVAEVWETLTPFSKQLHPWSYTQEDPTMAWYYSVKSAKKAAWIEPYYDEDLNKIVISYTKPVYKDENKLDKNFIGGIGIDITAEELERGISKIKLYDTGYAFLVSKGFYFIASKEFSIKDNLFEVKNGYYKPLLKEIQKSDSGIYRIKDDLIAFSKLYNGYRLFIVVPEKEIRAPIKRLNQTLIVFTLIAVVIVTLIMFSLVRVLFKMMDSLETSDKIIMTIANSIEAKDVYTKGHIDRVTSYSEKLGRHFKLSGDTMDTLRKAAMLHDIGKIGIPDDILNKPAKLTKEEFETMKSHTVFGAKILKPLESHKGLIDIVKNHHEKLDGSGYPDGLKGNEINLATRIVTIIDIYDALVSERPYKKPFTEEEAMRILDEEVEKGYLDKEVLNAFKNILKEEKQHSINK